MTRRHLAYDPAGNLYAAFDTRTYPGDDISASAIFGEVAPAGGSFSGNETAAQQVQQLDTAPVVTSAGDGAAIAVWATGIVNDYFSAQVSTYSPGGQSGASGPPPAAGPPPPAAGPPAPGAGPTAPPSTAPVIRRQTGRRQTAHDQRPHARGARGHRASDASWSRLRARQGSDPPRALPRRARRRESTSRPLHRQDHSV